MNFKRMFAWLVLVVTFAVLIFEVLQFKPVWEIILGAVLGFICAAIWIWDDLETPYGKSN